MPQVKYSWLPSGWSSGEPLAVGAAYFIQAEDEDPYRLRFSLVVTWKDDYNGGLTCRCVGWRTWLGELQGPCPPSGRLLHFPPSLPVNIVPCLPLAGTAAAAGVDLRDCRAPAADNRLGSGSRWQGQGGTHLPWKLHFAWDYF